MTEEQHFQNFVSTHKSFDEIVSQGVMTRNEVLATFLQVWLQCSIEVEMSKDDFSVKNFIKEAKQEFKDCYDMFEIEVPQMVEEVKLIKKLRKGETK